MLRKEAKLNHIAALNPNQFITLNFITSMFKLNIALFNFKTNFWSKI